MIKHILLGATLIFSSSVAHADNLHSYCKGVSEVAELTQMYNQKQLSMSNLYKAGKGFPKEMQKLFHYMIQEAYEQPRYSSEKYQQKTIREYGNRWYKACIENS